MLLHINFILLPTIWVGIFLPTNARNVVTETYPVATTSEITSVSAYSLSRYERGLEDYDEEQERLQAARRGRGMLMDDADHMDHTDHMEKEKAIKNDPWQGYYDFLINEGSFKFWAVFQVVTAVILIYSAFAAVYYAKYNFVQADYDYEDYFLRRSDSGRSNSNDMWSGLSSQTFQRILDAISSKKYS